jgi:hypothetical protein
MQVEGANVEANKDDNAEENKDINDDGIGT